MRIVNLDLKDIETFIIQGKYNKAADEIFEAVEIYSSTDDKEILLNCLNLLNLICDKSPRISLQAVKHTSSLINDQDSWIRLISLEILYQIAKYRPNLLIEPLNDIRSRLYDNDPPVRRLAVKIIGTLILSLHIDWEILQSIINEYTEKLMDNDWKVKLSVINTTQDIINQDYTRIKEIEPLLSMVIINLRDKDDDVARASAELLRILGNYFLSKEKIFYILLNLLYNEKPRVQELVFWLFGEIGKEKSSEIIPFIPKIINFLRNKSFRIQVKIIDALINIAENNFDQTWANLINSITESSDNSFKNALGNALYQVAQNNIDYIFPNLFEELENPSENVRKIIALVFRRLFDEYQIEIENEISRIIYKLESKYWRERRKTIQLLQNICLILESRKIALWITIELSNKLEDENDLDVRKEIIYTLDKINDQYPHIDEYIKKINDKLSTFQERIIEFQKVPVDFRKKLNSYIKNFKFNTTEIQLNQMYDRIIKDIQEFHNEINRFEYKRLAYDLLEEWEETKIQIIDELSIIKGFITDICEEKKQEYKSDLQAKINILIDRIDILKAQFDYIKNKSLENTSIENEEIVWYSEPTIHEKFNYISLLRRNLFKLDVDIREMLINNVEFDDIFKDLLSRWVAVKIEIQIFLNNLDRKIKDMKQKIIDDLSSVEIPAEISNISELDGLSEELTYQIVQGHIHSIISYGIEGIKKFNQNFNKLESKLDLLINKGGFEEAKKLIDMNNSQIKSFIEDTENQVENIIEKEEIFKREKNGFELYIQPFMEKWNNSKELLIHKSKKFMEKSKEKLYFHQLKHYLKIMNPIEFDLLSNYLGLNKEQIKEYVLKFISKNRLDAKIVNNSLYSPKIQSEITDFKELNLFKRIKTMGNQIEIGLRLNNPSNYDFKDLQITLRIPEYMEILKESGFPKYFQIDELKTGTNFKFRYFLRIDKEIKSHLASNTHDEIGLMIHYKGPFELQKRLSKKIDILLS
ncbi:MAG: hypothetical protein BAJALOKI3v1_630018 [Promethearchaeota archaeon]|nr:MAG: hypothetical protein BAJALOKI3v1_630018 [Candidatus Lokiarchaeota archaeon]